MNKWRYEYRKGGLFRKPTVVLQVCRAVTRVEDHGRCVDVETYYEWHDARPEELPRGSFDGCGWQA